MSVGVFRRKKVDIEIEDNRDPNADLIRVVALTMHFEGRRVLKNIDLGVRPGEIFVIMGPSGCGKTTLIKHISGLLPPDLGTVFIKGRDIYLLQEDELNELRKKMGMAFQGGALINSMTVLENVMLPLRECTNLPEEIIEVMGKIKLEMVGLLDARDLLPGDISGGMKKRAAIARAIALDPEILFFDEPSAGLDPITAAEVDNLIIKLNRVFGITMVVVTHDLASAFTIAHRIAMMEGGEIITIGTKEEIKEIDNPRVSDFINRKMREAEEAGRDIEKYFME